MKQPLYSVIFLSYNSSGKIVKAYDKLKALMSENNIDFEFIVIDDGSSDNSYQEAFKLESEYSNVKAYQLSRNFTSNYAIFAGFSVCKGDCASLVADDEQQPYPVLVEMYRKWEQGHKLILPYRQRNEDAFIKKTIANCFHKFMKLITDMDFPPGGLDTYLLDREILDLLNNKIHPVRTAVIPELLRLGFQPLLIPTIRKKSLNTKSRWTFKNKKRLAKDIIFSSSEWPLKLITCSGITFILLALILFILYLFNITSSGKQIFIFVTVISFFSGVILLALGIIGEYLIRIYEETKARPGYIIRKKSEK